MADYVCKHTAERVIPCSREEFNQADILLMAGIDVHGFEVEFADQESALYLFAEECGTPEMLPEAFSRFLGGLIKKAGLAYLQIGYAGYSNKCSSGSAGGGLWRIYGNGSLVYPMLGWPAEEGAL